MEAIKNEYDGPKKIARAVKNQALNLDFAYSGDAVEVDTGIKETIRGVKVSIMAMGIALYRVDVAGLFIDLGFHKFGEYIDHLAEEMGMSRTALYNWEYIGQAYITHRAELDKIGFNDDDGPTKLPFLPRALEHHPKRDVFKNIKGMTKREFEDWSRCEIIENDKNYKNVEIKKNGRRWFRLLMIFPLRTGDIMKTCLWKGRLLCKKMNTPKCSVSMTNQKPGCLTVSISESLNDSGQKNSRYIHCIYRYNQWLLLPQYRIIRYETGL